MAIYDQGAPGGVYQTPTFNFSTAGLPASFASILGAYNTAQPQVNAANTQRFDDLVGAYRDLYAEQQSRWNTMQARQDATLAEMRGNLGQLGTQERKDIDTRFEGMAGAAQQNLIGSGFGGSTVLPSVLSGIGRQATDAQGALSDRIAAQMLGFGGQSLQYGQALGQLGVQSSGQTIGDMLGFMERREDKGPDLATLAALAAQFGQGYGAGAGGLPQQYASARGTQRPLSLGEYNQAMGYGSIMNRSRGGFVGSDSGDYRWIG